MSKLDFSKGFAEQFHPSFHEKIQPIIESPEVYEIFQFLKKESGRGKKISPLSSDLFKSFKINLKDLKIILMGMDVYPSFKNNKPMSNGIGFDCRNYGKVSPQLEKLYGAWLDDCYKGREEEINSLVDWNNLSLQYLIDQGVMLTSAGLCTEKDKPGKYLNLWRPFWKKVYEDIFSTKEDLVFIYLGKEAFKLREFNTPFIHHVLHCEHPTSASYNNREMHHNNVFSQTNLLLKNNKGNSSEIEWLDVLPF